MATAKYELSKKQRMNNETIKDDRESSTSSAMVNGAHARYSQPNDMVVSVDMCFFCFDVLASMLHNQEEPKKPSFTNDS